MTREDLQKIVEGISDEQTGKILDAHSADIGKVKKDYDTLKAELAAAQKKIKDYETEIGGLRDSMGEAEKLQEKIEELQKTIDDRKAADDAARENKQLLDRFGKAIGEAQFLNEFTKEGVFTEFKAAVADESNAGKSDSEIYAALVENRDNLFIPEGGIPGVVSPGSDSASEIDNDVREIMGLPPIKN